MHRAMKIRNAIITPVIANMGHFFVGLELYSAGLITYDEFQRDYPGITQVDQDLDEQEQE